MSGLHLIREENFDGLEILNEASTGEVYIEGPFISCAKKNRNGRIYPKAVIEPAVEKYIKDYMETKTSVGEFHHPEYPKPNFKMAAVKTVNLRWEGDLVIGKAKVLNTAEGRKIKELLAEDIRLGVSSRGLGRADSMNKVSYYQINAFDVVEFPSGIECFVQPINESVLYNPDGSIYLLNEQQVEMVEHESKKTRPIDSASLIMALEQLSM